VAEAISYLPYGDVRYSSADTLAVKSNTPYAFAGKERDKESGLNYFEQRHLSASLGRFVSTDPVTVTADRLIDPQLLNPYAYARNNPYRYVDPDGRLLFLVPVVIWGAGAAWTAYDTYTTYQAEGAEAAAKSLAVDAAISAAGGVVAKGAVKAGKAAFKYFSKAGNAVDEVADIGKVAERTGPKGVDPAHHNANVMVKDADGSVISHERLVSGNMTTSEKALGFPKNTLASHTEARAVTNTPLKAGDTMTITGQKRPCPSCKGYMNRSASETGADIKYQWRENGTTKTWTAGEN